MKINKLIQDRWSPRAFEDRKVEQEKINALFEAARWAPSCMNEQPWRFVYVEKGGEGYGKVFDAVMEGNKPWAKDAPVLIVGMAKTNFVYKDRPNFHHLYDLGQAVGIMSIEATDLGLKMHQMGGVDFEILRSNLQIPEEYVTAVVVALGYQGDANNLPEPYKERENAPRARKELSEIVSAGKF